MKVAGTPPGVSARTGRPAPLHELYPVALWNETLRMAVDHGAGSVELPLVERYTSRPSADPAAGVGLALREPLRAGPPAASGFTVSLRRRPVLTRSVRVADAVHGLLDALDVAAQNLPTDLAARTRLLRTVLADRRVLILLDNARDAEQVRPLLPGGAGCLVVVTSRTRLTGLVATHAAQAVHLDVLTVSEARTLLARRLGDAWVAREPHVVDELIDAAARLPLALVIIAARATEHSRYPIGRLRRELVGPGRRLDALAGDDPLTDVRAVLSWSYRTLSPGAARMFRLLGTLPGPDIGVAAAASLVGAPVRAAETVIAELVDVHLLAEHRPYRYAQHDLLRTYAAELVDTDTEAERKTALYRLLDHYLHTAYAGLHLLTEVTEPITLPTAHPGAVPERLTDRGAALTWFGTERAAILAAIRQAHDAGLDRYVWQLAWTVEDFLDLQGHWNDWLTVQHLALSSAGRLDDLRMQAYSQRRLGRGYVQTGRLDEAETHYCQALRSYAELDDTTGQANTYFSRAWLRETQRRHRDAIDDTTTALALYRAAGHRVGEARVLNTLAWHHAELGEFRPARAYCAQALALNRELEDTYGEAAIWDTFGYVHHHLDDHDEALRCYRHSLDLYRQANDRYNEADVLTHRGDTYHASGDLDAARCDWRAALEIFDALDHPHAGSVRTRLAAADTGAR